MTFQKFFIRIFSLELNRSYKTFCPNDPTLGFVSSNQEFEPVPWRQMKTNGGAEPHHRRWKSSGSRRTRPSSSTGSDRSQTDCPDEPKRQRLMAASLTLKTKSSSSPSARCWASGGPRSKGSGESDPGELKPSKVRRDHQ